MPLIDHRYGKGRVRVMRVHRAGERHEVRELTVAVTFEGAAFAPSWTAGDNGAVVATDTIKNIVYIVAQENLEAGAEAFGIALARRYLDRYPQLERVQVGLEETRWRRATVDGAPHPHAWTLDGNGTPTASVGLGRDGEPAVTSGIDGYTFLKSTGSGWEGYVMDEYTTLPPTADRLAATAMDAHWTWRAAPPDYAAANEAVLRSMLEVFAGTYSRGIQDSLYRMGEAALAVVPALATVRMACPNKHYLPARLEPFGLPSDGSVFIATDEPHGQIECTVGR